MINKNNFVGTITDYSNNEHKNYILVKDSNFEIIESPKVVMSGLINLDNLKKINELFINCIQNFVTIIQNDSCYIDLNVFLENLKTLSIEEKGFMLFKKRSPGAYSISNNKIILRKKDGLKSIYHELLHCASRKKTDDTLFSGFYQSNNNGSIGRGLNEGYTALLEQRFFEQSESYNINRIISRALEEIVGKEKMYKFYFDADLFGLINELKNYIDEESITTFLVDLDKFTDFSLNRRPFNKHDEMIKRIVDFLLQCFINKVSNLIGNNLMSEDEFEKSYNNFIELLNYKCTVNKWEFELVTEEQIDEILKKNKVI